MTQQQDRFGTITVGEKVIDMIADPLSSSTPVGVFYQVYVSADDLPVFAPFQTVFGRFIVSATGDKPDTFNGQVTGTDMGDRGRNVNPSVNIAVWNRNIAT